MCKSWGTLATTERKRQEWRFGLLRLKNNTARRGRVARLIHSTPHSEFRTQMFLLERALALRQILCCQGPWIVDLRTPPGPEGSNGSLLCNCRGHPGF